MKITVKTGSNANITIPFQVVGDIDLADTSVKYMSFSESQVYGHDGVKMDVEYLEGKVRVTNPMYPVLLGRGLASDTVLSAYLCNYQVAEQISSGTYLNPT